MEIITIEELRRRFESQKAKSKLDLKVICPICKKTQSGQDLIDAGAGKSFEDVEKFIGFSCVGRWLSAGPFKKDNSKGCDWTLGGIFKLHKLEVVNLDGVKQPFFEIAKGE